MKMPRPPSIPLLMPALTVCKCWSVCSSLCVCVLRAFSAGANALIYCLPALWQCQGQRGQAAQRGEGSTATGKEQPGRQLHCCSSVKRMLRL